MEKILKSDYGKWMIFAVTSMANLVVSFSVNSLNLALPTLAREFGATQNNVSWLALVYSLVPCCTLLIFGRTAELYGYKKQFRIGFLFFGLVCMLTPLLSVNLNMLIFFRCLQGIGYSIMISITQAIVSRTFDSSKRGKALGINAVFISIGLAAGPTIGGFLLTHFSWHAVFYFNLPFCILGFIFTCIVMPEDKKDCTKNRTMDWLGALLFSISIGSFSIGLNFSNKWGLHSIWFLGSMLLSLLLLYLFVIHEKHTESPLMFLKLFNNRTFSFANIVCMLSYLVQQLITYLVPFYLIDILLMPSDASGLVMLASPLMMMVLSPIGGSLTDKRGTRFPSSIGLLFICVSCLLMSFLKETSSYIMVIFTLLIMGIGNGLSVSSINTAILNSAPRENAGVASGMLATMRNLGQTLGVAFSSVILTSRQLFYSHSVKLSSKSIYVLAQRDTYYFGIFILIAALFCVYLLPSHKTSDACTS
ncbi:MFS transporter [Clostridium sp. PL3]|uniref:MFS transporter n=1 Tax=Clostridium thailandense TaxID=2794346 RepID=A0A949WU03_9CLOT|nr:MFS transporter [Clostridium thailandense]MBV7272062.1 MFS transporter [Clostridium thailandense]